MLFVLIIVLIGLIIVGIGFLMEKYKNDIGPIFWIVGGVVLIISGVGMLNFSFDYITKSIQIEKSLADRDNIIRLLDENYEPKNLKRALEFNKTQKVSAKLNETWMWYCWQNCYSLDTIPIPQGKFVPQNIVEIKALLKQLNELPEVSK